MRNKKIIIFALVIILLTNLICGCGKEIIDKQPVDVRHTSAHTEVQTYNQPIWTGKAMFLIPMTRHINHPEKWEILWLYSYSDNTYSRKWAKCTESEYLAAKEYLDGDSTNDK